MKLRLRHIVLPPLFLVMWGVNLLSWYGVIMISTTLSLLDRIFDVFVVGVLTILFVCASIIIIWGEESLVKLGAWLKRNW